MTDTTPSAAASPLVAFDGNRPQTFLSPADAAAVGVSTTSAPAGSGPPAPPTWPPAMLFAELPAGPIKGRVFLRAEVLRYLRHQRLLSQQDMADDCLRRRFRLSIATIKRAEGREAVRFRTVREFARYFGVPVEYLLLESIK